MPQSRHADDEGAGAVDRIEHPAIRTVRGNVSEFLAVNAVIGIFGRESAAHDLLGAAIGFGDRVEGALRFIG